MIFFVVGSIFSYLIGSINTAVILSKSFYGKDIRNFGSKNAGATNAMRVFGKKVGAFVFLIDFLKGLLAVIFARILVALFDAPYETVLATGFFAQFGHTFPVFFGFKGGKGVATAAGAAAGIMPLTALSLIIIFAVIVTSTKYVSLASGLCAATYPILAYFLTNENKSEKFMFAACCSIMILLKHIPNFKRFVSGNEKKISFRPNKQ